jgi:hypothetical protein
MSYRALVLVFSSSLVAMKALALSPEICKSYNSSLLYASTEATMKEMDKLLVPSQFARSIAGYYAVAVVDEEHGDESGGGTNTFGVYGTFIFPCEVLPADLNEDIASQKGPPYCDPASNQTMVFTAGPSDVIAFYQCSPPPVRYFSYDLCISARTTEEYPFYPGQNFGDTISHFNLNTTTGTPFDSPSLVLQTGDWTSAETIADIVSGAGRRGGGGKPLIPRGAISSRAINSDVIEFWDRSSNESDDDSDDSSNESWSFSRPDVLAFLARITTDPERLTADPAYSAYKKLVWPVRFYFAHDDQETAQRRKPAMPAPKERCPATTEVVNEQLDFPPLLEELKNNIVSSYNESYGQSLSFTIGLNFTTLGFYDDWAAVLDRKDNYSYILCDRDAVYGMQENYLEPFQWPRLADRTTKLVMIGVVHGPLLNASYSSFGIDLYDNKMTALQSLWFMDSQLTGSAARYFSEETLQKNEEKRELVDHLFAIDFTGPGGCAQSPTPQWCVEFAESSYPKPLIRLGERVYGVAETTIGPCADTTIPSVALYFE